MVHAAWTMHHGSIFEKSHKSSIEFEGGYTDDSLSGHLYGMTTNSSSSFKVIGFFHRMATWDIFHHTIWHVRCCHSMSIFDIVFFFRPPYSPPTQFNAFFLIEFQPFSKFWVDLGFWLLPNLPIFGLGTSIKVRLVSLV